MTIDRSAARIGRAAAARDAALPVAKARVGVEERSRARVAERTRAGATERVTRENARMTRENIRAPVREQPMARARTQTPPIMARGHDEPRAVAPRIERATPHMTQPNAARGGGPPMNARAQMPAPAAPRAAAPAMPQGGGRRAAHQHRTTRWRRTGRWRRPRSGQAPMNESPALSRAFFCSTSCWRLEGLCVAPGAEDMLDVPLRGRFSEGSETSDFLEARRLLSHLSLRASVPEARRHACLRPRSQRSAA